MFGTLTDSNVRKSTSHQRSFAVIDAGLPARSRRRAAAASRSGRRRARRPRTSNLSGERLDVDVGEHVVRPVFDDALVLLGPRFREERLLRRDVLVAVEDQHLAARLRALEIPRDLARALVGTRRAADTAPSESRSRTRRRRASPRAAAAARPSAVPPSTRAGSCACAPALSRPATSLVRRNRRPATGSSRSYASSLPPASFTVRACPRRPPLPCRGRTFTPWRVARRRIARREVGEICLLPPSTRFDIGHETNAGVDSTSVTSIVPLAPHAQVLRGRGAAVAAAHDDDPR